MGRASAKQPYRLARSRAVPKGRPEAKRSGHPRPWKWRKDVRPSASDKLLLPCRIGQLERGDNRLIRRNQHTMGTLGESETGRHGIGDLPTVSDSSSLFLRKADVALVSDFGVCPRRLSYEGLSIQVGNRTEEGEVFRIPATVSFRFVTVVFKRSRFPPSPW